MSATLVGQSVWARWLSANQAERKMKPGIQKAA